MTDPVPEPGPLPEHHKQWFEQLLKAAKNGDLALLSCLDATTHEPRSVICLVNRAADNELLMTPVGHLATTDNPYDSYGPPSLESVTEAEEKQP
jgi:hypothetical protein